MKKSNPIPLEIRFAALAVDIVCFRILDGRLQLLVGKIGDDHEFFKGKWAHIGGMVQVNETAEQSAERLLRDKAGIGEIYKEQLYTFSAVDRDPRGRVVSVAYVALANDGHIQNLARAGIETQWVDISKLPKLAYDHTQITNFAIERLRARVMYADIARHFMLNEFTLSDLQKVYEAILGDGMDKRNFRKRILALDLLEDTGQKLKKGVMRPASLYRFK